MTKFDQKWVEAREAFRLQERLPGPLIYRR